MNDNATPWNADGWNTYEHIFLLDADMVTRERFFMFVHGVMPGDTYMVDDIKMIPMIDVTKSTDSNSY